MSDTSLKIRMGFYIVAPITLALSAFAYFSYQATHTPRTAQLLQSTQRVGEPLKASLPTPLWNYGKAFGDAVIRSELQDPNISLPLSSSGLYLAASLKNAKHAENIEAFNKGLESIQAHRRPCRHSPTLIG